MFLVQNMGCVWFVELCGNVPWKDVEVGKYPEGPETGEVRHFPLKMAQPDWKIVRLVMTIFGLIYS